MTVGILATGDEIVHGDTLNTNSHDIAHALSSEGLPLGVHVSCSDKEADIINSLHFLTQKHDIIIIIGGLGPTTDDLTRFALSQFTGQTLIQHAAALEHITSRLRDAHLGLNPGNIQQSLFPEHAQLLPNPVGSAMGCYYPWNNKHFFLLPGPPRECLPMFNHHVLPILQQTTHSQKQILKWRIFGLPESEIAQKLEEALQNIDCQTGYRWESPYIEFKVRCTPNLADKVKAVVDPILKPHIISSVDKKASENLRELIASIDKPITIIDEATGGLLQLLLSKPNIHHLLDFSGQHKNRLFFHINGLAEYWQQQQTLGTAQLIIDYSNRDQGGHETHTIPYRTAAVVEHAAEWLCFRLFHLINQLHQ
ncbi:MULTISPECIES: competence/damage-inducible protein A [Legionella]|uniref:Competence damage inducible protein CinA n=1 Tax=Legionella steelei TaxID=947033 RepID=A0A0W0ZHY9_9GAMM|nr:MULTISPECIES: competence/damage-inducible protein A [Legionella]KTD68580.1 competence damage inducible protein CinA [Legionella steelei]MBN9229088.1 competence/damage-inducible protein A [Legionella steelei]OJW05670.1 MAG: competence protein [Legionella sp. 39-23]